MALIDKETIRAEIERWTEEYIEQNEGYYPTAEAIALHFYDLGCRRTAEMYDDIEYERQRTEEAEIAKGLEEEVVAFIKYLEDNEKVANIRVVARHFYELGKNAGKEE